MQQMYSDLKYFKMKLDVISEQIDKLKALFPEEKREVRQQLSIPIITT